MDYHTQQHIRSFLKNLYDQSYQLLEYDLVFFKEHLLPRNYRILKYRAIHRMTYREIAKREERSTSRMRQIFHSTLSKLHTYIGEEYDYKYTISRNV